MKTETDKRLTFSNEDVKQIAIAAAYSGMSAKKFMEAAVISATLNVMLKQTKKK